MKKINFITTLSPEKQYEVYRWFWHSCILGVGALLIGIYCITPLLFNYWTLKKEIAILQKKLNNHEEMSKTKNALKAEYDTLHQYAQKIERYKEYPMNVSEYLIEIFDLSNDGIKIESVRCNKKSSEIIISSLTPEQAMVYAKHLSVSEKFADVNVLSVHYDISTKRFKSVIKATNIFL